MILDFSQREEYPQWAAKQLGIEREYFGKCSTITVIRNRKIVAVCVYSSFNEINCEVTVAATSKYWLRKDVLDILFKFPFAQLGCNRITLLVHEHNDAVINLSQKLGFTQEGCLRGFYPDGKNCIIFGILSSERTH